MEPIEIIVIIACVLIVGGVIGNYIYRKVKKLPTGECASCRKTKSGISLVDEYHKAYCKNKKCKKWKYTVWKTVYFFISIIVFYF